MTQVPIAAANAVKPFTAKQGQLATRAVDIWQRRRRHCALPRSFVEKFTPGGDWLMR